MKTNLLNMLALIKAKVKGRKCFFFLVYLFSLLLVPQNAQAIDADYKIDGITYHVLDASKPDSVVVAVYQLYSDDMNSPDKSQDWMKSRYNGVDNYVLYNNNTLYIPESVKLTQDITAYVTQVGGPGPVETYSSSLCKIVKHVVMGKKVRTLATGMFLNNDSIQTITLSQSIDSIHNQFLFHSHQTMGKFREFKMDGESEYFEVQDGILYTKGKKQLVSVPKKLTVNGTVIKFLYLASNQDDAINLPRTLEKIWANAIWGNPYIKNISIPDSCIYLGEDETLSFYAASNALEILQVANSNKKYIAKNSVLFERKPGTDTPIKLIRYAPGKTDTIYTIPEDVESVAVCAFHYAKKLKSVNLNNVKKLGNRAFNSCTDLKKITISEELETIEEECFQNCSNLAEFVEPDGNNCTNYHVDNQGNDKGILFNKNKTTLVSYPPARTPTSYKICEETINVADNAFYGAKKLKEIEITKNIVSIGNEAFRNCTNLEKVLYSESSTPIVEEFGQRCFYQCAALTELNFPASVKKIGYQCFRACTSLKTVTFESNTLEYLGGALFLDNKAALETFTIPADCSLDSIRNRTFLNQYNLKAINIPASVKYIGEHAFEMQPDVVFNPKLGNITFSTEGTPADSLTIDNSAFSGVTEISSLTLPERTDSIGIDAFKNWQITKVTLPAKTTKLSPQAFKHCTKLANIYVNNDNPRFASLSGYLCTKDLSTLYIFPIGKANTGYALMPPSLTALGDYALYDVGDNLNKVCIPKKVNTLGARTFGLSSGITDIAFLCDELIDPENMVKGLNISTFDDDELTLNDNAHDQRSDINIYLRKKVFVDYMANHNEKANDKYYEFYKNFKAIGCIPTIAHEDDANTTLSNEKYGDEYFVMGDGTAMLLSTTADVETYVVPRTVYIDYAYHPTGIGDYAFENANAHINEVVVSDSVGYVGAMAFMTTEATRTPENKMKPGSTTSNIKQVVFIADSPLDIATNHFNLSTDFNEFTTADGSAQKIYVKENSLEDYQSTWKTFENQIDYKIPIGITKLYGTFSREFAVDLDAINPDKEKPYLIAFTAGNPHYDASKNLTTVTMVSINHTGDNPEGSSGTGDGTYIPANTGVLLKAYNDSCNAFNETTSPEGAYYQIAETQKESYDGDNLMASVTVNSRTIQPVMNGMRNFYVAQGKLWSFTAPRNSTIHKSYLQLPEEVSPAGAKLAIVFVDPAADESTTGIESVNVNVNDNDNLYNLHGQRVNNAGKGIYIKNGKKYIKN